MKKLSTLLLQRPALLEQARVANLAFAYHTLEGFARRVVRAGLVGAVTLKAAAPEHERFCATLVAHECSPSVIDEHFTDEDLMDLADVVAFATGTARTDCTFRLEEIGDVFLTPLRAELERAGVAIDTVGTSSDAVC